MSDSTRGPVAEQRSAPGPREAASLGLPQAIALAGAAFERRDFATAERLCRTVLATVPEQADALNLLGGIAAQTGRAQEAAALLQRVCAAAPDSAAAHNNHANVLRQLGRLDAALAGYDRAIALKPDYAAAHFNRGNALRQLGQPEAALASYDKAIALAPGHPFAHLQRASVLRELRRPDEAVTSCNRAIALRPDGADAHFERGAALQDLDRLDEAVASYDSAIALRPDHAEACFKRANALQDLDRLEEAVAGYDRALALKPGDAEVHFKRGYALQELKRLDEAIAGYDRAIELDPDHSQAAKVNKALVLLVGGRLEEGLRIYETRWERKDFSGPGRRFGQPLWLGAEPVAGRTVLLHAEQGLGDTIQFCRYAPMVAALGARVVLEVQRPLAGLLRCLPGLGAVVARGAPLPAFDLHCPLMSLPLAFGTSPGIIPARPAYLRADPARVAAWAARLGPRSRIRVGLVWSGRSEHKNDRNRSIPLELLRRALPEGCEALSLQKEVREADREALEAAPAIRHFGDEIADFADTAALCALVDVVVSVDTSVAHLAGALGRPVWILLPWLPDWRWLLDRGDSPWYPTARLYRQVRRGDWDGVLDRVKADLAALGPEP